MTILSYLWPQGCGMQHDDASPYLREAKLGTAGVTLDPEPSSPHLDDSDRAILATLEEKKSHFRPCENLRELARATHIPRATVYRRLTKSLELIRRLVCWMLRLLSDAQKVRPVDLNHFRLYCECSRYRSREPDMTL
jgi:hypothetical protein